MSREAIAAALSAQDSDQLTAALRQAIRYSTHLNLIACNLTTLPEELRAVAAQVVALDLRNNQLTELPALLSELTALETIKLDGNPIKALPEALFSSPSLLHVEGVKGFTRGAPRRNLDLFMRRTRGLAEQPALRSALFQEVMVGKKPEQQPLSVLLSGLRGDFPELLERAQAALLSLSEARPLDASSHVYVLGNVAFKKTELKDALEALGAHYQRKPDANTTHFVLGTSPQVPEDVDGRAFTFLTSGAALEVLQANLSPSALEPAAAAPSALQISQSDAQAANINNLLLASDSASVEMALALIKAHGVPTGINTGLFAVAKLSNDEAQRALARKLLKKHGAPDVQKALADRGKIAYTGDKAEINTRHAIEALARMTDAIDWVQIARFARRVHGYGLSYALRRGTSDQKLELLREHTHDSGHLDLHDLLSPNYSPNYENSYSYYSPEPFLPEVYALTELKSLNLSSCLFKALPPGLSALKHLQRLDLSSNMMDALPPDFTELSELRELNLDLNCFPTVPDGLEKLSNLQRLSIQGNRQSSDSHIYTELTVPADLRAALPKCTFVDGLNAHQLQRKSWQTP